MEVCTHRKTLGKPIEIGETIMNKKIPTINLKMTTVKLDCEVWKLRPKLMVTWETPDFEIEESCREQLGLADPLKYWEWQMRMKQEWEDSKDGR